MKAAVIAAVAALVAVGAAAQAEAHPNPAGSIVDPSADHPGHVALDAMYGGDYPSFIIAMHREGNYSFNVHADTQSSAHANLFNNNPHRHLGVDFEWDAEGVGDGGHVAFAGTENDLIPPDDILHFDRSYQVRLRDTGADSTLLFHRFETLREGPGAERYMPAIDEGPVTHYSAAFDVTARDAGPVRVGISPDGTVGGIIGSRTLTLEAAGPFDVIRGEFVGLRSGQGYTMFVTNSTFGEHTGSVDIVTAAGPGDSYWRETVRDGRHIPDDGSRASAGVIASTAVVQVERTVSNVRVDVDIPHTSRGDLVVKLESPGGQVATLHDREGGFDNDVRGFYQSASVPSLRAMDGSPTQGDWTLTVDDVSGGGRGYLGEWTLQVWYEEGDLPLLLRNIPDMAVHADTTLRFRAAATGGAGGVLYELSGPEGAEVDGGVISWFPRAADVGTHEFSVTATDGSGGRSSRSFDVEVEEPFATGIEYTVSCRDRFLPNRITFCTPSFTATPAQAYVLSQGLYRDGGSFGTHGDVERVSSSETGRASTEFIPDDDRNWWVFWEPGGSRDADTSIFARYDPKPESKTSNNNGSITYTPTIESNPRPFSGQTALLEGATLVVEEGVPGFAHAELSGAASIDGDLEWSLGSGAPPGLSVLTHDGGARFFYDGRAAAGAYEFEPTVSFDGSSDRIPAVLVVQDPDPGLVRTVAISDIPDRRAYTYTLVRLQVDAHNATGDVTYELVDGPEGVTVDSDGVLRWRVVNGLVGQHAVVVGATDEAGGRALAGFLVEVRPPYAQDIVINSFLTNGGNHVDNIAATVPYFDVKVQIEYHEDGAPCTDDGEVVQCTHGGVGTLKKGANERPQRLDAPDNGRDYWWAIWPSGDTKGDSSTVYLNYTWRDSDRNDPLRVWYREPPVAFNPPPFLDEGIRFAATEGIHSFIDVEARDQSEDPDLRWWLPGRPEGLMVFPYGTHSARLFYDGTPHGGEREIRVTVRDSKPGSDDESSRITQTVLLTVEPDPERSRSVVLPEIPGAAVNALSTLRFPVDAHNATGDVAYSFMWAPDGARVDGSGTFEWVPGAGQVGTHTVILLAADGAGSASRHFTVEVGPPIVEIHGQAAGAAGALATSTFDATPAVPLMSQAWWDDGGAVGTEGAPEAFGSRANLTLEFRPDSSRIHWREFWDPDAGPAGTDASVYARFDAGRDGHRVIANPTPHNAPPVLPDGVRLEAALGLPAFAELEARDRTRPGGDLAWELGPGAPPGLSLVPAGPTTAWLVYDGGPAGIGEHRLTVAVTDGEHGVQAPVIFDLAAAPAGLPSSYVVVPGTTLVVGLDPAGTADGFALAGAPPAGAAVGGDGVFRWTPNATQEGSHRITALIERGGGTDEYRFGVLVRGSVSAVAVPQPPEGEGRIVVREHEEYSFAAGVTTLAGAGYSLTLDPPAADRAEGHRAPPDGAVLLQNGTFRWTPGEEQDGEHDVYLYLLAPGHAPAHAVLLLDVSEANSPPWIAPVGLTYVQAGTEVRVPINATDPDVPRQDVLLGVESGQAWAAVDQAASELVLRPGSGDANATAYTVTVSARDAPGSPDFVARDVQVVVLDRPPTLAISEIGDRSMPALTTLRLYPDAVGASGDVAFSLPTKPDGAAMAADGLITWLPRAGQVGSHAFVVRALDGAFPAERSFTVEVTEPFVDIIEHRNDGQSFGFQDSVFRASSAGGATSRVGWTDGTDFGREGSPGVAVGPEPADLRISISPVGDRTYWREFWAAGAGPGTDASVYAEFDPSEPDFTIRLSPYPFNTPPLLPDGIRFVVTSGIAEFYDVEARDPTRPAGDLSWSAGAGFPDSFRLLAAGPTTGRLIYNGGNITQGEHAFNVTASDGEHTAAAEVTVAVDPPSESLRISPLRDRTLDALSTLRFQAHAYNATGGVTYRLVDPPAGATMTPGGYFEWVPGNGEHGTPDQLGMHQLEVAASDETGTVSEEFTVTVRESFIESLTHTTSQRSCGWHSSFRATLDEAILSTNVGRDKDGAEVDYVTLTDVIIISGSESNCGRPTGGYTSYWREFWSGTNRNNFGTDASVFARIDHGRHNGVEIIPNPYRFNAAPFLPPGIALDAVQMAPTSVLIRANDPTRPDGDLTWSLHGAPGFVSVASEGADVGRLSYTGGYAEPGTYEFRVSASDGTSRSPRADATLTIAAPTPSPSLALNPIGDRDVRALSTLRFQAYASNAAGGVAYLLEGAPAGASVGLGGLFEWLPAADQEGNHTVTLRAVGPTGYVDEEFGVEVRGPLVLIENQTAGAPSGGSVPSTFEAAPAPDVAGLLGQVGWTDGEAFGAVGSPANVTSAANVTYAVPEDASRTYWGAFWEPGAAAGDGEGIPGTDASVYARFVPGTGGYEVIPNPYPFDAPPLLPASIRLQSGNGVPASVAIAAADSSVPEGGLSWSLEGAPPGLTISSIGDAAARLSYDGTLTVPGNNTVRVTASDGDHEATAEAVFEVGGNESPSLVLSPVGDKTVQDLTTLRFQADVYNATGALRLELPGAPDGASIGEDGVFVWVPEGQDRSAKYRMTLVAADDTGYAASSFEVKVNGPAIDIRSYNFGTATNAFGERDCTHGVRAVTERGHSGRAVKVVWIDYTTTEPGVTSGPYPRDGVHARSGTWSDGSTYGEIDGQGTISGHVNQGGYARKFLPDSDLTYWLMMWRGDKWADSAVYASFEPCVNEHDIVPNPVPFNGPPFLDGGIRMEVASTAPSSMAVAARDYTPPEGGLEWRLNPSAPPGLSVAPAGQLGAEIRYDGRPMEPGEYGFRVIASDGRLEDSERATLVVGPPPPASLDIIDIGDTSVRALSTLRLQAGSQHAAGDVSYSLAGGPYGASITPGGLLTWVPEAGQQGSHAITVEADDGGGAVREGFAVTVLPPIAEIDGVDGRLLEAGRAESVLSATPTGGALKARAWLVDGARIAPASGEVDMAAGGPREAAAEFLPHPSREYFWEIRESGADARADASIYAMLTPGQDGYEVIPNPHGADSAPFLDGHVWLIATEGQPSSLGLEAYDDAPPPGGLAWGLDGHPGSLSVRSTGALTAELAFSGNERGHSEHGFNVTISDGTRTTRAPATLVVRDSGYDPTAIDGLPDKSIEHGRLLTFLMPEGPDYEVTDGPAGASMDGRRFDWTPSESQVGRHNVTITSSSGAISDPGTFEVHVFAPGSGLPDHDLDRHKGEGWLRAGVREKYDLRFLANDDHLVIMEDSRETFQHSDFLANDAYWSHDGTGSPYAEMSVRNTFNGDCSRNTDPREFDFTNSFYGGWIRMEPHRDFSGYAIVQYGPGPGAPYTVNCDSPVANIIVEVLPVNDAPTLGGEAGHELEEGGTLNATLGAADVDSPADGLVFELSGAPAGMRVEGGRLVWETDEADGPGTYRFNVTVSDGEANSTASYGVNVTEANRPPVITEPAGDEYTAELGEALEVPFAATDPDVPEQDLTYRIASQDPPDAGVTIGAGGAVTWGADAPSFVVVELEVSDNATEPGVARKSVTLASPPSALPGSLRAVNDRFSLLSGGALGLPVLGNDKAPGRADLDAATLRVVDGPHHNATPARINVHGGLDTVQYRPLDGFSGLDTFTYEVASGIHASRANVTVRVDAFRLGPAEPQQAAENATLTYRMPVNNPGGSELSWSVASGPAGDASVNSTGHFTWTPGELDGGAEHTFGITATDNFTTDRRTLRVAVAEANQPPSLADPGPREAKLGVGFELQLAASDPDRPAQNLTYTIAADNSTAGFSVGAESGVLSWTPLTVEAARAVVRVSDGFDPPGTDEVAVRVTSVPGPALPEFGPLEVTALSTLRLDAAALSSFGGVGYSLAGAPEGARINRHGELTWVPAPEQAGRHVFEITAADSLGGDAAAVDVTVGRQIATLIGHEPPEGGLPGPDRVDFRAGEQALRYRLWHAEGGAHAADGPASLLGPGLRPPYPYFSPAAAEGRAHYIEMWLDGTEPGTDASVYALFEPGGAAGLVAMPNPHTFANYPPSLAGVGASHLATVGRNFTLPAAADDPDLPPQALRYEILSQNVTGAAEIGPLTGLLRWEPEAEGALEVVVRVTDGHVPPENDTAVITVEARNPTELELRADYARTTMGAEVSIPVLANDTITPPGRPYEVSVTDRGGAGASIRADGDAILYDPAGGFAGADSFEYTVTARSVTEDVSASANVTVEVVPIGRVYADEVRGASATFVAAMDVPGEYLWAVEAPDGAPAGGAGASGTLEWPPAGGAGYATISTEAPGNGLAHGEQYRLKVELPGSEPVYADFATLPAGESARHLPRLVSLGAVSHDRIEAEYLFRDPGPHEIAPGIGSGPPDLMLVTVADSPGTLATANATLTGLEPSTDYTVHVRPPSAPDFGGAATFPLGRTAALAAPAVTSVTAQGDTATFEIDGMGSGVRARLAGSGGDLIGDATPLGHRVTLEASGLEDDSTYVVEIRVAHYPWESRHTAYYAYSHPGTGASQITNDPPVITTPATGHRASSGIPFPLDLMATDPDPADTVAFEIVGDGLGAVLTPGGSLTWTPAPAQAGEQRITVRATDSDKQTDDLELVIDVDTSPFVEADQMVTVSAARNAPIIIDVVGNSTVYPPGAEVTITVSDPRAGDADAAEIRIEDGAIWFRAQASGDIQLYAFQYTLSIPDVVPDPRHTGTVFVNLIDADNRPPVFAPVQAEWDLPVGRDFTLDLDAADPEGQRVGYSIASATYAPENATGPAAVDPATGILTLDGSAPYSARVNVTASDGTGGASWVVISVSFSDRLLAADDRAVSDKSSPLLANLTANDLPPGSHVASVGYPETGSQALDYLLALGPHGGMPLDPTRVVAIPPYSNATATMRSEARLFDTAIGNFTLVNNTAILYEPSPAVGILAGGTEFRLAYEINHPAHNDTSRAILTVSLGEPGEALVAADIAASTPMWVPLPVDVLGDAPPEAARQYAISASQPRNGTAHVAGTHVVYQPDACFAGRDSFGFSLANPQADPAVTGATVTVDVLPPALEARTLVGEPVAASPFPPGAECGGTEVTIPVQPARGSATASGGSITYVPAPGSVGEAEVEYDVGGSRGTLTVLVHRPISVGEAAVQPVPEGGPVSYAIPLVNPDGAPVEWSLLSGPPGASVDASGTFEWDAPAGGARAEPYAATVRADVAGGGDGAEGVLLVRVYNATYPYLEARDDTFATAYAHTQALRVLDNDVVLPEPDNNAVIPGGARVTVAVSYDGDSLVDPRLSGTVQYNASAPGTESFGYTISAGGASSSATATVTAAGFSFAPTVPQEGPELEELVYRVPVNNPGGIDLTWSIPGEPRGSEAVNGTGHFTWTPTEEEGDGNARHFTVRAAGGGIAREAVVTATATEVNQAPVIAPVAGAHAAEVGVQFHLDLDASDADLPAQDLEFSVVGHNSTAALGIPEVDPATGNVTWSPADPATVLITVNVTDGFVPPGTDSVVLVVSATEDNLPPSAPDASRTIPEDSGPVAIAPGHSDPDGAAAITAAAVTSAMPIGDVTHNSTHVIYEPFENRNGTETVSYTVTDDGRPPLNATGAITITVAEANDAPVIGRIGDKEVDTGRTLVVDAEAIDADGDPLVFRLVPGTLPARGGPGNATFANGTLEWAVPSNYGNVTHSVAIVVEDGRGGTDRADFTITVHNVTEARNRPPTAEGSSNSTLEDTPVTIAPRISDPDGTPAITAVTDGAHGTADHTRTTVTYYPAQDFNGTDTISYTVTDGANSTLTATADITITVEEVNDPPVLSMPGDADAREGEPLRLDANATDVDGLEPAFALDPGTVPVGTGPNEAAFDAATGVLEWTPGEAHGGTVHTITITADDGRGGTSPPGTAVIRVEETNQAPAFAGLLDRYAVEVGTELPIRLAVVDPDEPAQGLTYQLVSYNSTVAPTLDAAGTVRWTPDRVEVLEIMVGVADDFGGPGGRGEALATLHAEASDTTAPTVTLLGDDPDPHELGDDYAAGDPGARADDGSPVVPDYSMLDVNEAGEYTVTYTAADGQGNVGRAERTVVVSDGTAPEIVLRGGGTVTHERGTPYVDAGADVIDNDPDYTGQAVPDASGVDADRVGTYEVSFTAPADGAGNAPLEATRRVVVQDESAPSITLAGDNPDPHELGEEYAEPGHSSDDGSPVVPDYSMLDVNEAGTYTVTYTAADGQGNVGRAFRTVVVSDGTAPVIALRGGGTVAHERGTPYVDAGADVTDNDPDYAGQAVPDASGVDAGRVGSYVVRFTAPADGAGNVPDPVTRAVDVVDGRAPAIVLAGDNPDPHELGEEYAEPGHSSDDGSPVVPDYSMLDVNEAGEYTVTYTAADGQGNVGRAFRTVVVSDGTAPVIALRGGGTVAHERGTPYVDAGADVTDNDPDYAGQAVPDASGVDAGRVGSYVVRFTAPADGAGNAPLPVTRRVNVNDNNAPAIALAGADPHRHELGMPYADPGVSTDEDARVDTDSGGVDVHEPGLYTVVYTATDGHNNRGTATRQVNVTDTTKPVIVLRGQASVAVEAGGAYSDAGADVRDNDPDYAGRASWDDSAVDTSSPGAYLVRFTAPADEAGNAPDPVTRRVVVADARVELRPVADAGYGTVQGVPVLIPVTANDHVAVPAGADVAITITQRPQSGSATPHGNGTVTYDPAGSPPGTYTFAYSLAALGATSGSAAVSVDVAADPALAPPPAANAPPVAPDSSRTVDEDGRLVFAPGATDPDGPAPDVTSVTQGAHGAATHTAATVTYDPADDYHGPDQITYTVTDAHGAADTGTVYITVAEVNDDPVLAPIGGRAVDEGEALSIRAEAADPDGDAVTFELGGGALPAGASFDAAAGVLEWTPGGGDGGAEYVITITARDGRNGTDSETLAVSVRDVADVVPSDGAARIREVVSGAEGRAVTFAAGTYRDLGVLRVLGAGVELAPAGGAAVTLAGNTSVHVLAERATVRGLSFEGITAPEAVRAAVTDGLTVTGNRISGSLSGVVACDAACAVEYADPSGWASDADICRVGHEACALRTGAASRATDAPVGSGAIISENTFEGMQYYSVANLAGGTLNAKRNHHGGGGAAFGGVSVEPWYADPGRTALAASGPAGLPPVSFGAGSCGAGLGRQAVPFSNAAWGAVSDVETQEIAATGTEAVTGLLLTAGPWEGGGGSEYPGAVTQARPAGGHEWAAVGPAGAQVAAGIPPGGSLGLELRLDLTAVPDSGFDSLSQEMAYLATCG